MILWAFPDLGIARFLYTWALLNYFVVFLNLVPLLELDGYWIFSDLIQVPDLRPRSLQFIRYDLWRKLCGREHITKQEVGLALYGILGVAFTILSLYTAFFFWETIFGGLISRAVERRARRPGAPPRAGDVPRWAAAPGRDRVGLLAIAAKVRSGIDAIRFRLQTTWRVEAANADRRVADVRRPAGGRALRPRGPREASGGIRQASPCSGRGTVHTRSTSYGPAPCR